MAMLLKLEFRHSNFCLITPAHDVSCHDGHQQAQEDHHHDFDQGKAAVGLCVWRFLMNIVSLVIGHDCFRFGSRLLTIRAGFIPRDYSFSIAA